MSSIDLRSVKQSFFSCDSCAEPNNESAKFCCGCGVSLFDPCPSCKSSVRRGQKFCESCGFNIVADFDKQLQTASERLGNARKALEHLDMATAKDHCLVIQKSSDARLQSYVDQARSLLQEIDRLEEEWKLKIENAEENALQAMAAKDFDAVIRWLGDIPPIMITRRGSSLLNQAESARLEIAKLRTTLKRLLADKDYPQAGRTLDQLLHWNGDSTELLSLAEKIGAIVLKSSQTSFQQGHYAEALSRLESVPQSYRNQTAFQSHRALIDNVVWLSDQVARSPYATPVLGRLVQRLGKLAPHDQRISGVIQQLLTKVKGAPANRLQLFDSWSGKVTGWSDAPISILGRPQQIDISDALLLQQFPTRFNVCLGLALQGLGIANQPQQFLPQRGRSSLKKLFSRKSSSESAWGIDAGSTAVRAVRLEQIAGKVKVAEAHWLPYSQPLCRANIELQASVLLRQKLDELAPKLQGDELPVWINLSTRELIGRFISLPPVSDKQLAVLIAKEMESQFPLSLDQLSTHHSLTGIGADGAPRAVGIAAKKQVVDQREKVFQESGIKVSGMQADVLALHNFLAFEHREWFEKDSNANATPNAICCIDAGAMGTTFHCATADTFWFRYLDVGGEDLTAKLATACRVTQDEADQWRQNPADIPELAIAMEAVEHRMQYLNGRLSQAFQQASQYIGDMTLQHILCTGGAVLTHGWVRHSLQTTRTTVLSSG